VGSLAREVAPCCPGLTSCGAVMAFRPWRRKIRWSRGCRANQQAPCHADGCIDSALLRSYLPQGLTQSSLYAIIHKLGNSTGLSLAAPRRASVGARTCRNTVSNLLADPAGRKTPAGFTNSRYLLVLHLHQRACSPAAALRHWLLVRGEVESEEEEQVRRDDANTGNGGEFLASALAHVGDMGPVGAGEVGEGCEVDEACKVLESTRLSN
jgi:hypothetical protein